MYYHHYYLLERWYHSVTSLGKSQPDTNSVNRKKRSTTWCTWTTSNCLQNSKKELDTLIQTVRIYSQDIGMEFGIEKCDLLVMKSSKRHMMEGVELPNQVKIRTLGEKEIYKFLGILKAVVFSHAYTSTYMQNHNDTINKQTREDFFKKYISHLIVRFACERELGIEQNCNILTYTLMAISVVSFSFWFSTRGPGAHSAGFIYCILSPTGLVPKLHRGSRGPLLLGGGFPYPISPNRLISNSIGGSCSSRRMALALNYLKSVDMPLKQRNLSNLKKLVFNFQFLVFKRC